MFYTQAKIDQLTANGKYSEIKAAIRYLEAMIDILFLHGSDNGVVHHEEIDRAEEWVMFLQMELKVRAIPTNNWNS